MCFNKAPSNVDLTPRHKWHSQAGLAVMQNLIPTPGGFSCDLFPKHKLFPFTCFMLLVPKKHFGNGFPDSVINALFHGVDTKRQTCGREL